MSDLIERQAAIDAIARSNLLTAGAMLDCKRKIENLPSAQPYSEAELQKMQELEQAELQKAYECGRASAQPEIIRCKDCKHWEGERRGYFYYFEQCSLHERTASSDDFCSWAERREE